MDLSKLKLYATKPHPCSYLTGEAATTIFIDPHTSVDSHIYSELSRYGFRRSGNNIYRPHCKNCQACVPLRLIAEQFKPNRSQKRCRKTNEDLTIRVVDSINTDEHYALYERYITERHSDGDMYPPDRSQYNDFLTTEWDATRYLEMREPSGKLVALSVIDVIDHGLSAVYTFFEPTEIRRSLGVFAVLYQIELAKQNQLPFVYLGYWIKQCQKMSYKTGYQPYQVFINEKWVTVSKDRHNNSARHELL